MRLEPLSAALQKIFPDLSPEQCNTTAYDVLTYFGYSDHCNSFQLSHVELSFFYILEDFGILTGTLEHIKLQDSRMWRIARFHLNVERIERLAVTPNALTPERTIYEDLPDDSFHSISVQGGGIS